MNWGVWILTGAIILSIVAVVYFLTFEGFMTQAEADARMGLSSDKFCAKQSSCGTCLSDSAHPGVECGWFLRRICARSAIGRGFCFCCAHNEFGCLLCFALSARLHRQSVFKDSTHQPVRWSWKGMLAALAALRAHQAAASCRLPWHAAPPSVANWSGSAATHFETASAPRTRSGLAP